jgi:hypothetical protein
MLVGELWCKCMIKLEKEHGVNHNDIHTAKSISEWRMLNDLTIGEIKLHGMKEWFVVYLPLQFNPITEQDEIIDNMCRQFIHQICNKLSHMDDHILKKVDKSLYNDILLVRTRSTEEIIKYDGQTRIAYLERDKVSSTAITKCEIIKHTKDELIIHRDSISITDKATILKDSRRINIYHIFGSGISQKSESIGISPWMDLINDPTDFYYTPYNVSIQKLLSSNLTPEYVGDNIYITANACTCIYVKLIGVWIPISRRWFEMNWHSLPEEIKSEYLMYESIEGVA